MKTKRYENIPAKLNQEHVSTYFAQHGLKAVLQPAVNWTIGAEIKRGHIREDGIFEAIGDRISVLIPDGVNEAEVDRLVQQMPAAAKTDPELRDDNEDRALDETLHRLKKKIRKFLKEEYGLDPIK